jgi:hypothetical protein
VRVELDRVLRELGKPRIAQEREEDSGEPAYRSRSDSSRQITAQRS